MTGQSGEPPQLPSDAELRLLRELWGAGDLTVREMHARVREDWPVGLTTVLKLLQRMHGKGLVRREEDGRAHRYRPAIDEEPLERHLVRDFLSRTFDGSVERLIQRALPRGGLDADESDEIRELLDSLGD